MAYNLKEALRYQVYVSSFRKRKIFLDILTPKQALLYKHWLLSNRERCNQALDEQRKVSTTLATSTAIAGGANSGGDGNSTLEALCRNLEEILRISKVITSEASTTVDSQQQQQHEEEEEDYVN
jgi:hypothetical protein